MKRQTPVSTLAIITTILIWSSAFIAIREGMKAYHAGSFAHFRLLIGAACMVLLYVIKPPKHFISFKDKVLAILLGAVGNGVYHIFLNLGEITVTAGVASFIIAQVPILTAIFGAIFLKEKLHKLAWLGFLVGFLGIFLIARDDLLSSKMDFGVFFILVSTMANCIYVMFAKNLLLRMGTLHMTVFCVVGGALSTVMFLPQLLQDVKLAPMDATWAGVYLGIFPTAIAFLTYNCALTYMTRTAATSWIYTMPLVTILMGWAWMGELPTVSDFSGGILALGGTILVNFATRLQNRKHQHQQQKPPEQSREPA